MMTYEMIGVADENGRTYESTELITEKRGSSLMMRLLNIQEKYSAVYCYTKIYGD